MCGWALSVSHQSIEALTEFADGAMVNKIGEIIERRGLTIDNRQQRAVAFGEDRK